MAHALRRILRFRKLAEDQARLEVERAVQSWRQTCAACERQIATERRQRSKLADSWSSETIGHGEGAANSKNFSGPMENPPAENVWLMEEAALEFLGLRRVRLEQIREVESRRIEPMIERYKEHRRELLQTEQLVARRDAIENAEKDRRAQADIDEWFLQRTLAGRRRTQQQERGLYTPPVPKE